MTQTRACTEPRTTKSAGMADAEGHAADTTGMKRGAPQCAVCIVPNSVQHRKGMPLMNTSRAALLRMKRFLPHNQNAWNGNMNTMVRVKTPYSTQKTSAFNHPEPLFLRTSHSHSYSFTLSHMPPSRRARKPHSCSTMSPQSSSSSPSFLRGQQWMCMHARSTAAYI